MSPSSHEEFLLDTPGGGSYLPRGAGTAPGRPAPGALRAAAPALDDLRSGESVATRRGTPYVTDAFKLSGLIRSMGLRERRGLARKTGSGELPGLVRVRVRVRP